MQARAGWEQAGGRAVWKWIYVHATQIWLFLHPSSIILLSLRISADNTPHSVSSTESNQRETERDRGEEERRKGEGAKGGGAAQRKKAASGKRSFHIHPHGRVRGQSGSFLVQNTRGRNLQNQPLAPVWFYCHLIQFIAPVLLVIFFASSSPFLLLYLYSVLFAV